MLFVAMVVLALAAVPTSPAAAAEGDLITETFQGSSVSDGRWLAFGDACLTGAAAGSSPPAGAADIGACEKTVDSPPLGEEPGYLQLTDNSVGSTSNVLYDRAIPSTAGLKITFTQYQYANTSTGLGSADGIGFFLTDGRYTLDQPGPTGSGAGGALGYASVRGQEGVQQGYLGLGLDVFGNYSAQPYVGESCTERHASARNSVALRGPGDGREGYCLLSTTPYGNLEGDNYTDAGREVEITVSPVTAADPYPTITVVIDGVQVSSVKMDVAAPPTFKMGFSAATGQGHEVHLVNLLSVSTVEPLGEISLVKSVDHSEETGTEKTIFTEGDVVPYSFLVTNTGAQEAIDNIVVTDPKIADISCPETTLAAQDSFVCTGSYGPLTAAEAAAGTFDNTARVVGVTAVSGTPVTDDSSATIPTYGLGEFAVTKAVTGTGANAVPSDTSFTVDYTYPSGPYVPASEDAAGNPHEYPAGSGELTVRNDGVAVTSEKLPKGAQVTLTERAPPEIDGVTWGTPEFSPSTVTIGDEPVEVTLTNPVERDPAPALSVAKGADTSAVSDDGQSVTYTVQATNVGAAAYTEENPAVVVDDLSGVLDDAVLDEASITADVGGAPTYAEPQIHWSGALGVGETVTITYVVTYEAGAGNAELVNVAFGPSCGEGDPTCSETPPPPPACDPADENGLDPVTGEPCARVEIPASNLLVSKSADPEDGSTVMAGEEITYTVTFENTGSAAARVDGWTDHVSGVLDDAEVTAQPAASSGDLTVTSIEDGAFSVSGSVPAGETVTVSYTVAVLADGERGDDLLANFVTPPGAEPPAECAEGDVLCTTHPVPEVTVAKGVDPADGSTVQAGGVLTYTLTFGNDGAAPGEVDEVDDLSHVIDDAEVTSAPVSSEEALTVSAIEDGRFTITGTLQPGQTVTVTYEVTVLPDGERGDDQLGNFLLEPGEEPPGSPEDCEEGDPRCTYNPVPVIVDSKSADPASGATVAPGQVVTYTLTFENQGAATGEIDKVDDLTHVLDDAEIVTEPTSSVDTVQVERASETQLAITGTLEPGATATITYQVKVAQDGNGDLQLANFLLPPGQEPPSEPVCEEGSEDCTSHPVPAVTIVKSADPASGSEVGAGDTITYSLTLENTGKGEAEVAFTDHMGGVLDDAELVDGPAADGESVTTKRVGDTIELTGSIAAGKTVVVSYTVEVLAFEKQGDHMLGNFVTVAGQEPPTTCVDGSTLCTTHDVPKPPAPPAPPGQPGGPDQPGPLLPDTGGPISIWLLVMAGLLVAGGAGMLIAQRRRTP